MKNRLLTLLALAGVSQLSFGELDIPRSVFRVEQMEEAKAKAVENEKPLIFVFTDPGTTWGICLATSSEAFKAFKSTGVVVFANSKTEFGSLPAGAKEVRAKGGNTIPMVLVTTADGTKGIDAIPYTTLKGDLRKSVRALKTTLKTTDVLGGKAGAEENATTTEEPREEPEPAFVDWENAKGKVITASVQEVKDGKVHFLLKNGKSVWYQISKLSEASQAKLSELK